jgi:lantibiotic modifying enzyme
MIISDEEFFAIVRAAASCEDFLYRKKREPFSMADAARTSSGLREALSERLRVEIPVWANELREMFDALPKFEFSSRNGSPLHKLCKCGARYGSQKLEARASLELLALLSQKARAHLERELERRIVRATRPSFTLELKAFRLAFWAIYNQREIELPGVMMKKFLGRKPCERLFPMFKRFPVLAKLWRVLISQWIDETAELLLRFSADRIALSQGFLASRPVDKIIDLRSGVSDPHNGGRTVAFIRCKGGSIIYKPRPGYGEREWFEFVRHLNAKGLRPDLRAAKVLCRDGYCWMEEIKCAPCKDQPAASRFYERLGATIAAAYLLRAVDCHRDNVIASGEHPVLIDAETLWHLSRSEQTQNRLKTLFQTGFISASKQRSSLQYRSSVLGRDDSGRHIPRISNERLNASKYEREIITGFRRTWQCTLGSRKRRIEFTRLWQGGRPKQVRWIFWPTESYIAIMRASIQPAALRSGIERDRLITRFCTRSALPRAILHEEINALRRLDVPYFIRKIKLGPLPPEEDAPPTQIIEALRRAAHL